ncbi:hypothetical protein ACHABX_12435 [Nesterenkonia halotolerans]|uniref:hypothetical protein n=1 Tax=Nesterenkonia halotolerans TaxID=225325 RepID=UPI003EE4B0B8
METTGSAPTPEEARRALDAAEQEERATIYRPVPPWYLPAIAALIFGALGLNALEDLSGATRILQVSLILMLTIGIGGLAGAVGLNHPGYQGIRLPWRPMLLSGSAAGAIPVAAIALDSILGGWVWLAAGAILAAGLLGVSIAYQRRPRGV